MNVYDSDKIMDVLTPHGFTPVDFPERAELILLNTCHIREKAAEKVFSQLGRYKKFKDAHAKEGRQVILCVAGCVAQAEGTEIVKRAPYVDVVCGPQTYHRLPEMVEQSRRYFQKTQAQNDPDTYTPPLHLVDTDFPIDSKFDDIPLPKNASAPSAFLTIQEGCDKFCTFCCVPYTRGAEYSRPVKDILAEARHLIQKGAQEITLLGQNVTAYHGQAPNGKSEWSMASLLLELSTLEGLKRLRYTTSHPRDIGNDLIDAHGQSEIIMPFLHLPVQSGSNRILKAMNRQHTREAYFDIIDALRSARPDLVLSSDFIVGYPGESEEDFQQTLELVEKVGFAQAYSFKYSPRPGTPASVQEDQVPEDIKDQRLQTLQALLIQQQSAYNTSKIGQTLPVLFERKGRNPGQLIGRSPYMQSVHARLAEDMIGKICHVDIECATLSSLGGTVNTTHESA